MQPIAKATINSLIVALPTVVFLLSSTHLLLGYALALAAAAALATFAFHLLRREPVVPALTGLLIASVCALVALITGQARAFFLIPAIILPIVIGVLCICSIIARRPLAGFLLNGLAGGPKLWWQQNALRNVYTYATWVCFIVNASTGLLQRFFYQRNEVMMLGVIHIATPLMFSAIIAVTIVCAKKANLD